MSLRSQQRALVAAITGAGSAPPLIDRTGHGLATYVDGYRLRLQDCLADDFPELVRALGTPAFARLAERVIADANSTERTLNHWSRRLPAWLDAHPRAYPAWVRDAARCEWAQCSTIHLPLGGQFDHAALAQLPPSAWPTLRLQATPNLQLIAIRWRLIDDAPQRFNGVAQIWRTSTGIRRRDLEPAAGRLLSALAAGKPLARAIAHARLPAASLNATLTTAVADGCFSGIIS